MVAVVKKKEDALLSRNQEIADRIVNEYAKCRELSLAAWKRLGEEQRDALTRYRGSGFLEINRLLRRGTVSSSMKKNKAAKKDEGDDDDPAVIDWQTLIMWSKPAAHWMMTPGKFSWGPEAADCALYETPIGSLDRIVERVRGAIRATVDTLDAVFSQKLASVLPKLAAPLTLFRGVTGEEAEAIIACEVGKTVLQPGYLSTSLSPMTARNFMRSDPARRKPKKNALLVIRVPAGVPFVFFDGITGGDNDHVAEMEIMLQRGVSIRKLSAARNMSDPDMYSRTEASALKKKSSSLMLVVDCELVAPSAETPPPPPQTGQNADDEPAVAVKLIPSQLSTNRSTACGYGRPSESSQ